MNTKQIKIFKVLTFIAGFVVIGAVFALVNSPFPENGLSSQQKFFWAQIIACYLAIFMPLFFSSITTKSVQTKITSTVHIWICVIVFEIVAIVLTFLVSKEILTVKTSVIIELIVVFFALVFVFFGYYAGTHIGNIHSQEGETLSKIAILKSTFETLNIKSDAWDFGLSKQKNSIKKICDDVRFMSPVDTEKAFEIEQKLVSAANNLIESSLSPSEIDSKILELTYLINQRKLQRN